MCGCVDPNAFACLDPSYPNVRACLDPSYPNVCACLDSAVCVLVLTACVLVLTVLLVPLTTLASSSARCMKSRLLDALVDDSRFLMRSCLSWSESAQQLRGHRQSGMHVACAREWHACDPPKAFQVPVSISLSLLTSGKCRHVLVAWLRGWRLRLVACMQASSESGAFD